MIQDVQNSRMYGTIGCDEGTFESADACTSESKEEGEQQMAIIVNLDVMMAKRKISAGELAERVGITPANLSILKNNKAKAVRFSTLEAICEVLECQPGDILEFRKE